MCPLSGWKKQFPTRLTWPQPTHRVEDGGGLSSSALCYNPVSTSPWPALRTRWFNRLCSSKGCLKIVAHFENGNPAAHRLNWLRILMTCFQSFRWNTCGSSWISLLLASFSVCNSGRCWYLLGMTVRLLSLMYLKVVFGWASIPPLHLLLPGPLVSMQLQKISPYWNVFHHGKVHWTTLTESRSW